MSDISATEQRLSAALDRIDRGIGRLRHASAHGAAADRAARAGGTEAGASDRPVAAELHRRQEAAIRQARQRLVSAGAEAARLAAANDQLIAANRALIDAADVTAFADAALAAQNAEIEALRAARDAELAQMGDVLASLEAMLGIAADDGAEDTAPPAESAAEAAGFDEDLSPLEPEGQIVRFGRSDAVAEDDGAAEGRDADDHEDEKG